MASSPVPPPPPGIFHLHTSVKISAHLPLSPRMSPVTPINTRAPAPKGVDTRMASATSTVMLVGVAASPVSVISFLPRCLFFGLSPPPLLSQDRVGGVMYLPTPCRSFFLFFFLQIFLNVEPELLPCCMRKSSDLRSCRRLLAASSGTTKRCW